MSLHWPWIVAYCCVVLHDAGCQGRTLSMRIVDEPTTYQWQQGNRGNTVTLKAKVQPAPFSGPPHLSRLINKCFQKEIGKYRYELCPFANVTQHEIGISWNLYNGILGVWREWQITDNHFTAMLMKNGDTCGTRERSVDVILSCGDVNVLESVAEPTMCSYQLLFKTPLVCHPHSMLVYPALPQQLKDAWNVLVGELQRDELTPKGYELGVASIFRQAGYFASPDDVVPAQATTHQPVTVGNRFGAQAGLGALAAASGNQSLPFQNLGECQLEYQLLADELIRLRRQKQAT